ncbi:hypothetical protein EVAR_66436_1 [Eumeta japonica]|uniref:Uncharacterized protein n=1 Tax=Eumeta variegata TaxID=151549 RepID=A0A4C1ZI45_EUMVA|nr:hypothetical protein EVAR_66436_1 [Eumeta japonica]
MALHVKKLFKFPFRPTSANRRVHAPQIAAIMCATCQLYACNRKHTVRRTSPLPILNILLNTTSVGTSAPRSLATTDIDLNLVDFDFDLLPPFNLGTTLLSLIITGKKPPSKYFLKTKAFKCIDQIGRMEEFQGQNLRRKS